MSPNPAAGRECLDRLAALLGHPLDLVTEQHGPEERIGLAYITGLTDRVDINANLLQPLLCLAAGSAPSPWMGSRPSFRRQNPGARGFGRGLKRPPRRPGRSLCGRSADVGLAKGISTS